MRTTRIELDGEAGHLAIQRERGSRTIRIDSIVRDPEQGQQVWKTWQLDIGTGDEELFKIAIELWRRTEGRTDTRSIVHEYFNDLRRFQD